MVKDNPVTRLDQFRQRQLEALVNEVTISEVTSELYKGSYHLHAYITGLVVSATLMQKLSISLRPGLRFAWGQILNENSNVMSREIDLMVSKDVPIHYWEPIGYSIERPENISLVFEVKYRGISTSDIQAWYSGVSQVFKPENTGKKVEFILVILQDKSKLKNSDDILKREQKTIANLKKWKGAPEDYVDVQFNDVFILSAPKSKSDVLLYNLKSWKRLIKLIETQYPTSYWS